jgi:hypothetical protein
LHVRPIDLGLRHGGGRPVGSFELTI